MSDLINGREMLKRYQEDLCYGIACKDCSMCTEDGGCRVEEWIDKFPSADRQQEWIPCSERLPSEKDYIGDVVIWCTDKSIVGVGWYYESTKSWATIDDTFPPILGEVIAWMPLPKPWKGADDE